MISVEAKNQFQHIITYEMFEMERALEHVYDATLENEASRGWGQPGGVALSTMTQDATNSIKSREQFILGQLLRCLAAHHVTLDAETVTEVSSLLRETIAAQVQVVLIRLLHKPPFSISGLEQAKQQLLA